MEKIITDKDGKKTAVAVPTQRPKTFGEIRKNIEDAEKKVKQYMPPSNKKKRTEGAPDQSGITDKSFNKGGITGNVFKKSF